MTITTRVWSTTQEKDFIDRLGLEGHTQKLGRLGALRAYATGLARRTEWTNVNGKEIQVYLAIAVHRAEQDERIQSFHAP